MGLRIDGTAPLLINPEPITVKGIKTACSELFRIYTDKHGQMYAFNAVGPKPEGSALGAIFKKATQLDTDKQWMGKVGYPRGILRNDPSTIRKRARRELNIDTIREKLAYDLFHELGRDLFLVPKTRLSYLPIRDDFNLTHWLANDWISRGITHSLRIMSRYTKGYADLNKAKTLGGDLEMSFMEYLANYHRPPESILSPGHVLVPLRGLMGLLAVGRCLADVDLLGGAGFNAGFIWEYNSQEEIIAARIVKIDPGYAFCFTHDDPQDACENFVINTQRSLGPACYHLADLKNIQTSTGNHKAIVHWHTLTEKQQDEFLGALLNTARYLQAEASPTASSSGAASSSSRSERSSTTHTESVLDLLFYRENQFFYADDALMPKEHAEQLQHDMTRWVGWQLEIYAQPLAAFKQKYPEQILRIKYIDEFGELPLPLSSETYPIREMFTELYLIEEEKEERKGLADMLDFSLGSASSSSAASSSSSSSASASYSPAISSKTLSSLDRTLLPSERDSLQEASHLQRRPTALVHLDRLFSEKTKIALVMGRPGTGKSTLCRKIAHDWASGKLFHFQAVYLIPVRNLNHTPIVGDSLEQWLAAAIARIVLDDAALAPYVCKQILEKRSEILFVLDGFDEAIAEVRQAIQPLFHDPELHILLSSRPGHDFPMAQIDRLIENIGFSDEQIKLYCHQFFTRKDGGATADRFLKAIKDNASFYHLAHTPLHLQMLCALWEKNPHMATTLTGLYETLVGEILHWERSRLGDSLSHSPHTILYALGSIAMSGLENGTLVIPAASMQQSLERTTLTTQDLLDTGLIKMTNQGYFFIHLTFQEYLAAYQLNAMSEEQQHVFLTKFQGNPSYHMVIIFLCGMIFRHNPENMQRFFDAMGICEGNLVLTFRCLNECEGYLGDIPAIERLFAEKPEIVDKAIEMHDKGLALFGERLPLALFLSIQNQIYSLRWLLHKKPELIHQRDEEEQTLLMAEAFNGNIEMMEFLCCQPDGTALLSKFCKNGVTPLHLAALNGHIEAMNWLCNKDSSLLTHFCNDGLTPLHYAALNGRTEAMEWLYKKAPSLLTKFSKYGETLLHLAAENGHVEAMEWLYKKAPSLLTTFTDDGLTPFDLAAFNGHIGAMEWFMNKNPSLISKLYYNQYDFFRPTPLYTAVRYGYIEAMEWLCTRDPSLLSKFRHDGTTPLHLAAEKGHIEAMEWLCNRDPSLLTKFRKDGTTPLHWAAEKGHIEAMEWLWTRDPSLLAQFRKDGTTPLHLAAEKGHIKAMEWLCTRDPSLLTQCRHDGKTPLHLAAWNNHVEAMEWLCDRDFSSKSRNDGITSLDWASWDRRIEAIQWLCNRNSSLFNKSSGQTPLGWAALDGHVGAMEWLCNRDPSLLSEFSNEGLPPLHSAAWNGHIRAMEWLCNQDPSLLTKFCNEGETPLHWAAEKGHIEAMEWLCNRDPSLLTKFRKDGTTPLHLAAEKGHIGAMEWLCNRDPSLLTKFEDDGETPLHLAAGGGHIGAMEWLCNRDSSLLTKFRNDGETPLHQAALNGHIGAMEWLCKRDSSLLTKFRNDGITPLHWAAENGQVEAIKWLCDRDPSLLTIPSNIGLTPLHQAALNGHIGAIELLCDRDPSLLAKLSNIGLTPLHSAAWNGHIGAMEWLCNRDSSLLSKFCNDGTTPLHIAAQNGDISAMEWLVAKAPKLLQERTNSGRIPYDAAAAAYKYRAADWLSKRMRAEDIEVSQSLSQQTITSAPSTSNTRTLSSSSSISNHIVRSNENKPISRLSSVEGGTPKCMIS